MKPYVKDENWWKKKIGFQPDGWQMDVLETKGNMVLRSGRQVGKSTIIALKAAVYALNNEKKLIMVISKTEKQASLLFQKILHNIVELAPSKVREGKHGPTLHKIELKNGSVIHSLPCGDTGYGLMGFTINLLIADEAAFIREEVWNSILPALAVAKGQIWLLSTPFLKQGYYYKCFSNPSFTSFHTTSEACPRRDDEFLAEMKKELTRAQYGQMYLGEFVDEFNRVFNKAWIDSVCTLPPMSEDQLSSSVKPHSGGRIFLGMDIGRVDDPSTFEGLDGGDKKNIRQVFHFENRQTSIPNTARQAIKLHREWNFSKIGVDSGGLGIGVIDMLLEEKSTKYKVIALNNASRVHDSTEKEKKMLKDEMYTNLLRLGEQDHIKLFNSDEVKASLASIQRDEEGQINGIDSHITEGLIRAAECIKRKGLNIMNFC